MLCLVAEHIHAGEHADTAKEQCNQEQRTLRDAPFVADRPALVEGHGCKADKIDQHQIYD